jgi:putative ABC transport system permease protein
VPVLRGRSFTSADRAGAPAVVLINQAMARTYFKGLDPVGQQVTFDRVPDSTSLWRTIVGVVGDERQNQLSGAAEPEFSAPFAQDGRHGMILVVRTRDDPAAFAPAIRRIIARMDPALAISSIDTMDGVRAQSLSRERFLTTLMLSFAAVGLVLGLVGVYGVVAQIAKRRTREMGIRIALGAKAGNVQWLVVRHGLSITALGIGVGIAVALAATGALRALLYQVAPTDPLIFVAVPLLVLVTAALASWLPARRASRADPCEVLRGD